MRFVHKSDSPVHWDCSIDTGLLDSGLNQINLNLNLNLERLMYEFTMHYQPKIMHGRMISCEALLRPKHKINVEQFVQTCPDPIRLDILVIKQVMKELCLHAIDVNTSVNINAKSIMNDAFVNFCLTEVQGKGITLEITEYSDIDNRALFAKNIAKLQQGKIKISLDDFGKGYAHSILLVKNKFDEIKLDKSLIDNIDTDGDVFCHLKYLIEMLRKMGFTKFVFEGVETLKQQEQILKIDNNAILQGYFYSKPTPMKALIDGWHSTC
ncbi:diguanylate cyclase [Vibrio alfacsensis]|nr:diguanylate cyclase [Vibrio alfacsensis]